MQGTLYPQGSIISKSILLLVLLISIINVYIANIKYKLPEYFKGLNLLLTMFVLYGLLVIAWGRYLPVGVSKISYIQGILISILPIYSSYVYSRKGLITQKSLFIWVPIWIIVAISSFYFNKHNLIADLVSGREEITNNVSYSFVALMPALVLYSRKPLVLFGLLLLCMLYVLLGMKRGAIIISIVLFIWFILRTIKTSSIKIKRWIIALGISFLLFMSIVVSHMISESDYFATRIEQTLEGSTSGRDTIYEILWSNFINETNLLKLIVGGGANYTLAVAGNYAHQDWLEILINQGLLGVLIYLFYFICFYRSWKKSKSSPEIYTGLGMVLCICFMTSLFSMGYGNMEIYATLMLGYFLASSQNNKYTSNVQ